MIVKIADVVITVNFGREDVSDVAIYGGDHSASKNAVFDSRLMTNL